MSIGANQKFAQATADFPLRNSLPVNSGRPKAVPSRPRKQKIGVRKFGTPLEQASSRSIDDAVQLLC
jgi:hypothetical protein